MRGRYVLATYHAGRFAALVWCPHRARERAQLMATRRYLNFDLLLEQEGEGRYQARVTDSPLGETPSVRFRAAVRRDHAREPPPQARPRAVGHAQGRRYGPAAGRHGLRRSALPGGVHRRPGPRLAAQPGPGTGRAGRRASSPPPAQRRAGDRRTAVGAAVRRPVQQLPGAVGAHAAGAVPRRAAGTSADRGRRTAARAGDHLLADRPRRARRRGRVGAARRRPSSHGPRPAWSCSTGCRARRSRSSGPGCGVRRPTCVHFIGHGDFDPGLREGVIYFQDQAGPAQRGHLVDAGPVPARPRPPADGGPQRLPVGAHRHAPTRSAGWPRASSSRTPPRSSPCSSRSATAPR